MKRSATYHFGGRRSGFGAGVGDGLHEIYDTEDDLRKAWNAERDLHRTFRKAGLSLPIPIRTLDHVLPDGKEISIEHVLPSDWFTYLVQSCPELLAGGYSSLGDQLSGFWELYRYQHPSHQVYQQHAGELDHVFPIQFWGDEGRGPKRAGYMAGTIESCLGLDEMSFDCDCSRKLETFDSSWVPHSCEAVHLETQSMKAVSSVATNYKGHSFLTRYLLFGIPGYLYANKASIVKAHLDVVAQDLVTLFTEGVQVKGQRFWAAFIGSKGDLKFQASVVAQMTRSYMNLGRVRDLACCSLCLAGTTEFPMEDVQHQPHWASSMFHERPWKEDGPQPSFLVVPYDAAKPEEVYRLDFFHVFKVGIGRDLVGSTLVWLCKLEVFDLDSEPQNLPSRLQRAHRRFQLWALANRKSPGLRSLSKSFLNCPTSADSPWSNTKGSDTVLMLGFLEWLLTIELRDIAEPMVAHENMLRLLLHVITNSLEMCQVCYKHPVFMPRVCAQRLYCNIMVVVRGYKRLAEYFVAQEIAGFRLKPKLHSLHHLAFSIREVLHTPAPKVMNLMVHGCEMNEDHIGHTARMSRKLATTTLGLRLMQRYMLKTKAVIRRHFHKRKAKA